MARRFALVLAMLSGLSYAGDTAGAIRRQEAALASALETRNTAVLASLVDKGFTIHWAGYTFERIVDVAEGRDAWLEHLRHMQAQSYAQSISNIEVPNSSQAIVTLDEHWTIVLASGAYLDKRFRTTDFWFRVGQDWKLTGRDCKPDLRFKQ